ARRCLAHDALLGCQGRRVDRPGGTGERADPAPRELAPARARRVRVTRHARPRQRAVPYSRRVGGPAPGGSTRSRRPRRPTGARVPGGDAPQARRGGRGATGARGTDHPAAAGSRHTTARPPRSPPSMMANLARRQRTVTAAGERQKLVKEMAAQANTEVRSERILPPAERGELLEIPVEIAVSGEVRQLVDLLARLDGAPKLLTVQDFRLRVVNVSQPKEL